MKYWLGVVSEDHVKKGVTEGFAQVCHGKKSALSRIQKNDWLIYYSPKKTVDGTEVCKSFTAIGVAKDDLVFQFEVTKKFKPYRRNIKYYKCKAVPLELIKSKLEMTQDKNWGYKLRFGLIELSGSDFDTIKQAMMGIN